MNINKFSLFIKSEEIYNKILPEQREQLDDVIITSAKLFDNKCVYIECVALEKGSKITELPYIQGGLLSDNADITVKDI